MARSRLSDIPPPIPGDRDEPVKLRFLADSERLSGIQTELARMGRQCVVYVVRATERVKRLQAVAESDAGRSGMSYRSPAPLVKKRGAAPAPAPAPARVFTHAQVLRLASIETAARLSPAFQALFAAAEREQFSSCLIPDWMELCSVLQEELIVRALRALAGPTAAMTARMGEATPSLASKSEPVQDPLVSFDAPPELLAHAVVHSIGADPSTILGLPPCPTGLEDWEGLVDYPVHLGAYMQGLREMRTGGYDFPDTVGKVQIYKKYNRARQGELKRHNPAPDAPLVTLDGTCTSLHALALAAHPRPLVVVAGSYS